MKSVFAAIVAVSIVVTTGVVVSVGTPIVPITHVGSNAVVLQFGWLVDIIEAIDRLLEAIVDLLQTIRRLFGGEGGD